MTDTCTHCQVRGDFPTCIGTPCNQHDSWYAQQLQLHLEAAKHALQFYADGKHYDTVGLILDGPKHTRILDNGAIAKEALDWLAETLDAKNDDPPVSEIECAVEAAAQRLMATIKDPLVWSIGYTLGLKQDTIVVYCDPCCGRRSPMPLPAEWEGFMVEIHVGPRPSVTLP